MARQAREAGLRPVIVLDRVEFDEDGVETAILSPAVLTRIQTGDPLVISPHLPWPVLAPLLRGHLSFDVDSHGLGALEGMESSDGTPGWRRFQGRRRTSHRLALLLRHGSCTYLSVPEQTTFLGGMLFRSGRLRDANLASRLPERIVYAPMGISARPFHGDPVDWGPKIGNRPVFLWGGGIWSWFDIPTLIGAFSRLARRGHPAVLYFLTNSNPSGLNSQDVPVRDAIRCAENAGILGTSVFFHQGTVSPTELPGYLAGCRAGILSNPRRLESLASWRTRLLDLLWAGKPAIISGTDPLSERMAECGAAFQVEAGDQEGLADAIERMCGDQVGWSSSCARSSELGGRLKWDTTLAGPRARWTNPSHWTSRPSVQWREIARCLLGL